jgi:hypothetical protein
MLLMRYDPETGKLYWLERPRVFFKSDKDHKRWNTRYAGNEAFSPNNNGYLDGMIFRRMYRAHQVAWALHYGEWPKDQIDHINGDRSDNRITNLRVVSRSENCRNTKLRSNSKTGVLGVYRHKHRWRATIYDGGSRHIGLFDTFEDAVAARKAAERELGYHPNHGRPA